MKQLSTEHEMRERITAFFKLEDINTIKDECLISTHVWLIRIESATVL